MKISRVHITNPSYKAGQEKEYFFPLSEFGEELIPEFDRNKEEDQKKLSAICEKVEKWCLRNNVDPREIRFGDPEEPNVESFIYCKPLK